MGGAISLKGLNAPSGAQCFPTETYELIVTVDKSQCTFWCSVLSDAECPTRKTEFQVSQCTFWCSVLSDMSVDEFVNAPLSSQCTFWCSVLSDHLRTDLRGSRLLVSMHLLVLSAFRPRNLGFEDAPFWGLNAPSGAQCFPTPPPENRATPPFTGTKSPPTWKAPHRIGSHLSN